MKIISVNASSQYDVIIGSDILSNTGDYISKIKSIEKAAIISDTNVWPTYGCTVSDSLMNAGIQAKAFILAAGEASKNAENYIQILNFLAEMKITRSDVVIALGGGVIGDIAGFAAATFLRGISYIQIPTSLLAMVDSSVGGKTAIDLPAGKNLAGAFKQPDLVLCDVQTLRTLPRENFLDGCAEIIKYGMLYDPELFHYLTNVGTDFDREMVISKCVAWKRTVVQDDEFDNGARQKLNLGHTIGHAIEARSNFEISHGKAVAAGMAIITRSAVSRNYCSLQVLEELEIILRLFELPVTTTYAADEMCISALSDKKRSGDILNLIIPRQVGQCDIVQTAVSELKSFIEAGL